MAEFWEKAFNEKREMWGFDPAKSAIIADAVFTENKVKNVLIPGVGYGRNAQFFLDSGKQVTGIEISATAIALAKSHFGNSLKIYHGNVTAMPYDDVVYDGIFCYAVIHLLDKEERLKLIRDCYNQLSENGIMLFATITKQAETYGQGSCIGQDQYELFGGVKLFFYDHESIQEDFGDYGLSDILEVKENYPFYLIKCRKEA